MTTPENILVIKLGALGDFILALGPMAAIRRHHPDARITLLTTRVFVELAQASKLFDEVWVDEKPKITQPKKTIELAKRLRGGNFARVYDLQTSDRSSFYFRLLQPFAGIIPGLGRRVEWSGIASGASHRDTSPDRTRLHTIERQKQQLFIAGINDVPAPDLSWANADISQYGIGGEYALLVPGGSAHRPAKRWAGENYEKIAGRLLAGGITPVLIGAGAEMAILSMIERNVPGTLNLCGRTGFMEIAALARGAGAALGGDTGPMHLIAAAGCPSLVLFSAESNPDLCRPRGDLVKVLARDDLGDLEEGEVWTMLTLISRGS